MAIKRFVGAREALRQDVHGKMLEHVTISVESINGTVLVTIDGENRSKYYSLARADWDLIRQI